METHRPVVEIPSRCIRDLCRLPMYCSPYQHVLRTNFAFASRPPENPSLIDYLGPWPLYLFAMQGIALVLFLLLALPFRKRCA